MIGTLSRANLNNGRKTNWKLELQDGKVLYGKTKADVVHKAFTLYELDDVFEGMSRHSAQSYLNASRKYGTRTYWGARA